MSWNRRSSRLTVGRGIDYLLPWNPVEGKHEGPLIIRRFDFIVDLDQQTSFVVGIRIGVDLANLDPRLPHPERFLDVVGREAGGGRIVRSEHQLVNLAAELR